MSGGHYPLGTNPFDVIPWPGDASVVLILDPCIIPDPGQRIFEWSRDLLRSDCLYVNTPWEPVQDVSPWAVWLNGPDDPLLWHFLQHEAVKEAGYLMVTPVAAPEFGRWMRQRIQVEWAPCAVELVRISHPALAREVIGDSLIRTGPEGAIRQMLLPDITSGQWVHMAPKGGGLAPEPGQTISLSDGLRGSFARFNLRRANLMIWEKLDHQTRTALGGSALPDAWPELCRLSEEAAARGSEGIRSRMQYISQRCTERLSTDYANSI